MKKILIVISLCLLMLTSCTKTEKQTTVAEDYPEITGECIIKKASKEDILSMLRKGTGVVFFSWIDCPWCHRYINNLNEICRDTGLEVLYYDIYNDREEDTDFYKEVTELLREALDESDAYDSNGKERIYVPDVSFLIKGEIIGHDNSGSMESDFEKNAEAYWSAVMEEGNTREETVRNNFREWAEKVRTVKDEIDSKGCADDNGCAIKKES